MSCVMWLKEMCEMGALSGGRSGHSAVKAVRSEVVFLSPSSELKAGERRTCPECNSTKIERDEEGTLWCGTCGILLLKAELPVRALDGIEQRQNSSDSPLSFRSGTAPDKATLMQLMNRNIIGDVGGWNFPLRLALLSQASASTNWLDEFAKPALEHAKEMLDWFGWSSPRDEGGYNPRNPNYDGESGQLGSLVGKLIRRFYWCLVSELRFLGYVANNGNGNGRLRLGPFSIQHRVVAETAVAVACLNDDRKLRYALGFRFNEKTKEWKFRKNGPRLTNYDEQLAQSFVGIISRNGRPIFRSDLMKNG